MMMMMMMFVYLNDVEDVIRNCSKGRSDWITENTLQVTE